MYSVSRRRIAVAYILQRILVGVVVLLFLALIESVGLLLLLNASSQPGSIASRFAAWTAISPHLLILLSLIILDIFLALLLAWWLAKPLAIRAYVRRVRKEQDNNLYTPLTALMNVYETPINYQHTDPNLLRERQNLHDLVQQQDSHLLILGLTGAGKTTALLAYRYRVLLHMWQLIRGRERIPVFIPMRDYNVFLKGINLTEYTQQGQDGDKGATQSSALLDYLLSSSSQESVWYLHPFLNQLAAKGRLLLLCDGLNEIDSNFLEFVCTELASLMQHSQNALIMTCRERDYREQRPLQQLINYAAEAVITPLELHQIQEFVERYVNNQQEWRHSPEEVNRVIERSRLRYHCTNPMMLYTLMKTINDIDLEHGAALDTRGRLLREFASQVIQTELKKSKWNEKRLTEEEIVAFLALVACTGRRAGYRNAVPLLSTRPITGTNRRALPSRELAQALLDWVDNPDVPGENDEEDELEPIHQPYNRAEIERLLEFAQDASLITISQNGVLSFRHELIAEYFVAEYLYQLDRHNQAALPYSGDILHQDIGSWSEPITLWAGFLSDPMVLAQRLADGGQRDPAVAYNALALSLSCVGVIWMPPQGQGRSIVLPDTVTELLQHYVSHKETRIRLAAIFRRCAEEGGLEVYRSLLPLLHITWVSHLLKEIKDPNIPHLLFEYLYDAIDQRRYGKMMPSLIKALALFGEQAVPRAAELSLPAPDHSLRLRVAAIQILRYTGSQQAVGTLIPYLYDREVIEEAAKGLAALGPELALVPVIEAMERPLPAADLAQLRLSAVSVLKSFLSNASLSPAHYQRIVDALVFALSSTYTNEAQQVTKSILMQLVNTGRGSSDNGWEYALEALIRDLAIDDETLANNIILVLSDAGQLATPSLLRTLKQSTREALRARILEVLGRVGDQRALPHVLPLIVDTSPRVQEKAAEALRHYAPTSIPLLIELVLSPTESQIMATRAARVLESIGQESVPYVTEALLRVVPGRTQLLIDVLIDVHDALAVDPLITLLHASEKDTSLAVPSIQALGQFSEQRVVTPLLHMLEHPEPLIYTEAGKALSRLDAVALDQLIATLDVEQETVLTARVRGALLDMKDFPKQRLLDAFSSCSEALAQQIITLFTQKQIEVAQFLVDNLFHEDERTRAYIQQTIDHMDASATIEPLLKALNCSAGQRPIVAHCLLKHSTAIPRLFVLLSDAERKSNAYETLLDFGTSVFPALVGGLALPDPAARVLVQDITVKLVQQDLTLVSKVIHLFDPVASHLLSLPEGAHKGLQAILTERLADVSVPPLLQAMEDVSLAEDVAECLKQMVMKGNITLSTIVAALREEAQRQTAAKTLVKLGPDLPAAADEVSLLITHPVQEVASAARSILHDMGEAAFAAIWASYSNSSDPKRRTVAIGIFDSMGTEAIQAGLIKNLMSDNPVDVAMALSLLSRRIYAEADLPDDGQKMISALLDHAQKDSNHLRVIALLLLLTGDKLSGNKLADLILHFMYDHREHHKDFVQALALLGNAAVEPLKRVLRMRGSTSRLRGEAASVLGMITPHNDVFRYVRSLGQYNVSQRPVSLNSNEQLNMYLRAFGGLLAGGNCTVSDLERLRSESRDEIEREFYDVLLGSRNMPKMKLLRAELETIQAALNSSQLTVQQRDHDLKQARAALLQVSTENQNLQSQVGRLEGQNTALEGQVNLLEQQLIAARNRPRSQYQGPYGF